mmetsp:Transcript_49621/g.138872  ORF Transcript_49621/g.138872 Transcript_49621/m.138872 type:complete len:335 (-) Transcript_49621:122-1126(-)
MVGGTSIVGTRADGYAATAKVASHGHRAEGIAAAAAACVAAVEAAMAACAASVARSAMEAMTSRSSAFDSAASLVASILLWATLSALAIRALNMSSLAFCSAWATRSLDSCSALVTISRAACCASAAFMRSASSCLANSCCIVDSCRASCSLRRWFSSVNISRSFLACSAILLLRNASCLATEICSVCAARSCSYSSCNIFSAASRCSVAALAAMVASNSAAVKASRISLSQSVGVQGEIREDGGACGITGIGGTLSGADVRVTTVPARSSSVDASLCPVVALRAPRLNAATNSTAWCLNPTAVPPSSMACTASGARPAFLEASSCQRPRKPAC